MADPNKDQSSCKKDEEVQAKNSNRNLNLDNPGQEEQTNEEVQKPDKNEQYRKDNW